LVFVEMNRGGEETAARVCCHSLFFFVSLHSHKGFSVHSQMQLSWLNLCADRASLTSRANRFVGFCGYAR
jgi:hypothetical protein